MAERILVYIPLNPTLPRLYGRALMGVMRQEYPRYQVLLDRDDTPPGVVRAGVVAYGNICEKYNFAREVALREGYDALLTVEADMVIPPDTLTRLLAVDADVAYGLYCSRHNKYRWLAFTEITERHGLSLDEEPERARAAWGKVIETRGVGLGCTLIRRHVLEAIRFRWEGGFLANDWYFSLDCIERGFVQKHDLGVVCGHITKRPSPRIIWPSPEPNDLGRLYRVEFLELPSVRRGERMVVSEFGLHAARVE